MGPVAVAVAVSTDSVQSTMHNRNTQAIAVWL